MTSATTRPAQSTSTSSGCWASWPGPTNPLIEVIGGLGIRLHTYLPTRTFELAVHGLDIARATGLSFDVPDDVLDEAMVLAARIGVATGDGETLLLALTGRAALPASFSVV